MLGIKKNIDVCTMKNSITRLAIFASGAGSNADKILSHFKNSTAIAVELIICNKKEAGIYKVAEKYNVPSVHISKKQFTETNIAVDTLIQYNIDVVILAGFLLQIPPALVEAFPNRIINIHPALLPNYSGKGMYGHFVHEAVIENKEKESGITIHLVDEQYDHGAHLFQAKCTIAPEDTAETLATKIHTLEHAHFPTVIEEFISKL